MTMLLEEHDMSIADCLRECGGQVRTVAASRWEFELQGEVPLRVTAWLDKEWLRLCAPLSPRSASRPAPETLYQMLAYNAHLAAAKFTLADDPVLPCVSADVLTGEEGGELGTRVARVCDSFHKAARAFARGPLREGCCNQAERTPEAEELSEELSPELAALCKGTGWPMAQRAADCLVFELDVAGSFYQAVARSSGANGLRLAVDLGGEPELDGARRRALSVVLLHAAHCVRMARPTVRTLDGMTAYGWEVVLDHVGSVRDVEHALAALSVACRLCGREVLALEQDDCLARSYLALRGWRV